MKKDFFENKHHFKVEYVGHPWTLTERKNQLLFSKRINYQTRKPHRIITGSRKQEIKKMLPIFLKVSALFPQFEFVLAGAPGIDPDWYQKFFSGEKGKVLKMKPTSCSYMPGRLCVKRNSHIRNRTT